jgi:hypothetical protein
MKRVHAQKPKSQRGRPWLEILPTDSRNLDVVRAKALVHAQRGARLRRMREPANLNRAGRPPDVLRAGYGLST